MRRPVSNFSPTSQATSQYIASEIHRDSNDAVTNYNTAIITAQQAATFISLSSDYAEKACVSLNAIFVPYAMYDTSYVDNAGTSGVVFPSGNISSLEVGNRIAKSMSMTVDTQFNTDNIEPDNMYDDVEYRGVGLNKDVFFVGTPDEVIASGITETPENQIPVAGPLDLAWDADELKWVAGASTAFKPVVCFCTDALISEPAQGDYTEFNTTAGIARNYDPNLRITDAEDIVIYGAFVKKLYAGPSGSGVTYNGNGFILPYYIGCPA